MLGQQHPGNNGRTHQLIMLSARLQQDSLKCSASTLQLLHPSS